MVFDLLDREFTRLCSKLEQLADGTLKLAAMRMPKGTQGPVVPEFLVLAPT
jgi:hypothetical protein